MTHLVDESLLIFRFNSKTSLRLISCSTFVISLLMYVLLKSNVLERYSVASVLLNLRASESKALTTHGLFIITRRLHIVSSSEILRNWVFQILPLGLWWPVMVDFGSLLWWELAGVLWRHHCTLYSISWQRGFWGGCVFRWWTLHIGWGERG